MHFFLTKTNSLVFYLWRQTVLLHNDMGALGHLAMLGCDLVYNTNAPGERQGLHKRGARKTTLPHPSSLREALHQLDHLQQKHRPHACPNTGRTAPEASQGATPALLR